VTLKVFGHILGLSNAIIGLTSKTVVST
jgi:hypothetical protein